MVRVLAAQDHSLAPSTSSDKYLAVMQAIMDATDMDINQWYDMLQAGRWYDVVQKLW